MRVGWHDMISAETEITLQRTKIELSALSAKIKLLRKGIVSFSCGQFARQSPGHPSKTSKF